MQENINEVHNEVDSTGISIGDLSLLNSDISAVDLVSAINKNYEYQKNNTGTQTTIVNRVGFVSVINDKQVTRDRVSHWC